MGSRKPARACMVSACAALAFALAACAPSGSPPPAGPRSLVPAAEAASAPPLTTEPAGRVVQVGPVAKGIVADPATGLVAVAVRQPPRLMLLDGDTGKTVDTTRLPAAARHLGLAQPGGPVLVPAENADRLVKVSLPGGKVTASIPVGNFPHDATKAGGRVFVTNEFGHSVWVLNRNQVVRKLRGYPQPSGVAAAAGRLGVVDVRGTFLTVYELSGLRQVGTVPAGEGPTHVDTNGRRLYVVDTRGEAVLAFRVRPSVKQVARARVPGAPYGIAVDARRGRLWVTLTARNRLVQFSLDSGALRRVRAYPTVRQPNSVAVNPATGRVYVAGRDKGIVQIVTPQR